MAATINLHLDYDQPPVVAAYRAPRNDRMTLLIETEGARVAIFGTPEQLQHIAYEINRALTEQQIEAAI